MKIPSIHFFYRRVKERYYTLKRFITNVWAFRQELANDTGNDYTDALAFFKRSLERQIPNAMSYDQDCSSYYEVINSIDRIINPPYSLEDVYKKYGIDKIPFRFENGRVIAPFHSLDPATRKDFHKDILSYCNNETMSEERDVENFAKLIQKHLRNLWV